MNIYSVPGTEQGPRDKVMNRTEPHLCWAPREGNGNHKLILYLLCSVVGEVQYGAVGGPQRGVETSTWSPAVPEGSDRAADSAELRG